jgi:CD109 antigen
VVPEIQAKAELFIQTGYQRQLTYRHQDGSFSAFGEQDETGSLWLTAFVLSTFANAREVQTIDETILSEAASWMLSHQKADGSFESVGTVIHQEMIGGVNAGYGLTAFATLALLDYGSADSTQVASAVDYLASALENEKIDSYILSLITSALMKADHPQAENALERLLEQSIVGSDGIHWEPHPVETTGYAIMALVEAERLEAQPAIEWLSTQRNAFGGFHSTQDTVVGLKALTLAAMAQGRDLDAVVDVIIDNEIVHSFTVGQDNFDVLQSLELDPVDAFTLKINGTGKVFYQVAQSYNVPVAPVQQEDQLQLTVHYDAEHIAVDDLVDVQVSVLYQGNLEKTGMSIVDISIPTGFAAVPASLDRLREWENVKRIEVAGRKVIFYFDHFAYAEPIEFTFQVKALFPVRADSGTSEAYLYYDTGVRTEATGALLQVE